MIKGIKILQYLLIFTMVCYGKESIVVYYGNQVLNGQSEYDMFEVISDEIIITQNKIEFMNLNLEKEITRTEYEKIFKLLLNTLKSKKMSTCYNIKNKNNSLITRVPSKTINEMNMIIKYNEKYYCIVGKNELLEYLNSEYSLNIKWENDPLDIKKILDSKKIELSYGRKEVLTQEISYHRREEIETKIIIYKNKIEIKSLDWTNFQTNELSTGEFNRLANLIQDTLKEEKFVICDGVINPNSVIHSEAGYLKPLTTIIYLNNKEYCILGKNKLVEYLDYKYNLNIEW